MEVQKDMRIYTVVTETFQGNIGQQRDHNFHVLELLPVFGNTFGSNRIHRKPFRQFWITFEM